jgi:hypothetical protein
LLISPQNKSTYLKTGVGYAELFSSCVSSWLGDKAETHELVLTGTLTVGILEQRFQQPSNKQEHRTFCCFKYRDKLYINWSEVVLHLVGVNNVYLMARRMRVLVYTVGGPFFFATKRLEYQYA